MTICKARFSSSKFAETSSSSQILPNVMKRPLYLCVTIMKKRAVFLGIRPIELPMFRRGLTLHLVFTVVVVL